MARSSSHGGPSKSELIRDYLAKHPTASPGEVFDALKGHGISRSFITVVKYTEKHRRIRPALETKTATVTEDETKAAAIQELAQNRTGAIHPRAIQTKLAEKGIVVRLSQIRQVLTSMGMRRQRRPPGTATKS